MARKQCTQVEAKAMMQIVVTKTIIEIVMVTINVFEAAETHNKVESKIMGTLDSIPCKLAFTVWSTDPRP
jgi:hypothetical protein